MDSRLIWVISAVIVGVILTAFFLGFFNGLIGFITAFGFLSFVLLLLLVGVLIAIIVNFEGVPRLLAFVALSVIGFIFLVIPNIVLTQNFGSLFSLGFVGFFIGVLALDVLSPPYPTAELLLIVPLRKFFGIPFWLAELLSLLLALGTLIIVAFFYPFVIDVFLSNLVITPIVVLGSIIYFFIVYFSFDKIMDSF